MNKKILSPVFSVFFLLLVTCGLSQDNDLIVTTKGDSIACRIDSITKTHIYFEMKSQNNWAQTHIGLTDVSEYKRNAIDKKQFEFKAGTSIIESPKPASPGSIRDIQKNSVYVGILTLSYARMIPGEHVGINLAGGINFFVALFGGGVLFMGEISLLTGGTKHFFEPGLLMAMNSEVFLPMVRTGYRYQGPDGFLFRAGILLAYDDGLSGLPALSIGYSF